MGIDLFEPNFAASGLQIVVESLQLSSCEREVQPPTHLDAYSFERVELRPRDRGQRPAILEPHFTGRVQALGKLPVRFKSIKARFKTPVFPGETIVTDLWKESDTEYIVSARVKERDKVVVSNARATLR